VVVGVAGTGPVGAVDTVAPGSDILVVVAGAAADTAEAGIAVAGVSSWSSLIPPRLQPRLL